ncbi:MAG: dephospho-CoA kinase [Candidatus Kapabacteria bacterium]|nr:dephospho-CoA kinase [Candidatus Kapabacteria bacterium]
MQVIGITGVIGSGKTTLASLIEKEGFKVFYTDNLAKEIIESDETVRAKLVSEFGKEVFKADGQLNSNYLAELVFSSESDENLEKLNNIIHPPVIQKMIDITNNCEKAGDKMIFFESALIFEAGLDEGFDYIITVVSDIEKTIERLEHKMNRVDILKRLAKQIPQEEKAKNSDFVIENNGSIEDLKKSIKFILNIIKSDLN